MKKVIIVLVGCYHRRNAGGVQQELHECALYFGKVGHHREEILARDHEV